MAGQCGSCSRFGDDSVDPEEEAWGRPCRPSLSPLGVWRWGSSLPHLVCQASCLLGEQKADPWGTAEAQEQGHQEGTSLGMGQVRGCTREGLQE